MRLLAGTLAAGSMVTLPVAISACTPQPAADADCVVVVDAGGPAPTRTDSQPDAGADAAKAQWATGKDSTFEDFTPALPQCLSDQRCPFKPAPIPPCPRTVEAHPIEQVVQELAGLVGRSVSVRGWLYPLTGGVLETCRFDRCCNRSVGFLVVASRGWRNPTPFPGHHRIALGVPDARDPFQCRGDDSLTCCGFEVESPVVVEGVVVPPPEGTNIPFSLEAPRLCSLPVPPAPDADADIPDRPGKPPSVVDQHPVRFTRKRTPKGLDEAKRLFSDAKAMLQAGKWTEQQRGRCPAEAGGNVGIDGRSLVTDTQGRVRAFADAGGTEDSYRTSRYFFDEQGGLRFIFITYANYMGTQSENLVALGESGQIVGCDNLVLKKGGLEIDPCTERWHLAVEPQAEFDKCRE